MSTILGRVKDWLAAHPEERQVVDAPREVTDLAGATHRPFVMTPELRRAMAARVAIAVPTHARDVVDVDRMQRIQGLPVDVLIVLEGLAMMADNGNVLAARLLVEERRRLGIDPDLISYGGKT